MNNHHQYSNPKVCKKHNLPIVLIDQQLNLPMCLTCVQEIKGMVSIDQIQQKLQEILINGDKEFQNGQQQLQQLQESILNYKESLIKGIDKIIKTIIDQMQNIKITKQNFEEQILAGSQLINLEQLKYQLNNQQDQFKKVKIQIEQQLTKFQQKYINIDYLKEILTQSNEIIEVKYEKIQKLEKFKYELVDQSRIKESKYCRAFSFNKENSNLIIGCGQMIKIYQFINGKFGKQLQVLQNHTDDVICLYFMKQSNCFVSGSRDKSIIIWKLDTKNQWVLQQMLADHIDFIYCLLMNKNEDLLISGSQDETVKFWKKDKDKWSCKQTIKTEDCVFAISLNEMENKLVSCGLAAFIYVMQIQDNNEWSKIQKIKVNQFGEIFDFDSNSDEFRKLKQVQIQSGLDVNFYSPCQFVKQFNIVLVSHGEFLNIIRINEQKNYQLIQTIVYGHYDISGTVSSGGQHLITWDEDSKVIQVRKLKYMND